jgi:malate dehydrogenase
MNHAQAVPADRWFAMTMLDQNRARRQLAKKAGIDVTYVTNMAIWGNHSTTMYPDFYNARIGGRPALEIIPDEAWFKDTFIPAIQKRGAAIIGARGASSAASAAGAVVDTVRALTTPTAAGDCFSVAVCSEGSYGIEPGLIYSFPVRSDGRKWSVILDVPINEFSRAKLMATENELKEEKAMLGALLTN